VRDGTDAVFLKLEEDGITGYGEATLPPYLKETIGSVIERISSIAQRRTLSVEELLGSLDQLAEITDETNGCRAALHMALIDLIGKRSQRTAAQLIGSSVVKSPVALVTVGISDSDKIERKLMELPASGGLKVKVNGRGSIAQLERIKDLDSRRLFIDANQGLQDVDEAMDLIHAVGAERMIGLEQPFTVDQDIMNKDLAERSGLIIYGDESVQQMSDLDQKHGCFGGVNLKLMKCGGLDRAVAMADRARQLGMRVMLGSMSESSLGCTAMSALAGEADIVDLDGPWLIKNDPFVGLTMEDGKLQIPSGPGVAARLVADLSFTPIPA
jgi:L-alanine-DL-glutamate epimerase-like enolase superfamily enzyme